MVRYQDLQFQPKGARTATCVLDSSWMAAMNACFVLFPPILSTLRNGSPGHACCKSWEFTQENGRRRSKCL